ncbi:hypothetical protein GA0070624_0771 [Micromonospora rhizosphaerae]|uniref:Lipoprotein n=1 Tax=Micromonospora rhizosphaerae TaxID=568872 RepID=A0A1C6REY4_9ACTN|nr:hypothetical protein GA0070624_0771 [Micromonospora rhizosphaerae]
MPPTAPRPAALRRLTVPVALLAVLPLAGCGTPPELRQPAQGAAAPTATGAPTPSAPTAAPTTPAARTVTPTASDLVAVPCRSGPSGDRVVSLLRGSARVLPRDVRVRVRIGPLCAGDWQYTVLAVTGHEELQAVTRGRPTALELVTAGTDVCGVEVRALAPPGIRTLACDGAPGA